MGSQGLTKPGVGFRLWVRSTEFIDLYSPPTAARRPSGEGQLVARHDGAAPGGHGQSARGRRGLGRGGDGFEHRQRGLRLGVSGTS
jgi:hypothetical protein